MKRICSILLAVMLSFCFTAVECFATTARLSDFGPSNQNSNFWNRSFTINDSRTGQSITVPFWADYIQEKQNNLVIYNSSSQFSPEGQNAYHKLIQAILNQDSQVDIPVINLTERNQFDTVLRKEHPEFYYVNTISAGLIHTDAQGNQYEEITLDYFTSTADLGEVIKDYAPKRGTDYQKVLAAHDTLIDHTYYEDMHYTKDNVSRALEDCFIHHGTSSLGYAVGLRALLNEAGVRCTLVSGTFTRNGKTVPQYWNVVTINGKDYAVDTYQDDPNGRQHYSSHRWFALSRKEMDQDHHPDQPNLESRCNYKDQNYYRKNHLYFTSAAEAEASIRSQLKNHKTEAEVQLSSPELARQVRDNFMSGPSDNGMRGSEPDLTHNVVSVYLTNYIPQ